MNSMLNALARVGLASQDEVAQSGLREKDELLEKQAALLPKTPEELTIHRNYKFFERVKWLIEWLEENPSPERSTAALICAKKHMTGGSAGHTFVRQIEEFQSGKLSISQWKKTWPKIFV